MAGNRIGIICVLALFLVSSFLFPASRTTTWHLTHPRVVEAICNIGIFINRPTRKTENGKRRTGNGKRILSTSRAFREAKCLYPGISAPLDLDLAIHPDVLKLLPFPICISIFVLIGVFLYWGLVSNLQWVYNENMFHNEWHFSIILLAWFHSYITKGGVSSTLGVNYDISWIVMRYNWLPVLCIMVLC